MLQRVLLVLCLFIGTALVQLILNKCILFILLNVEKIEFLTLNIIKKLNRYQYLAVTILSLSMGLGMYEMVQFYLFNGTYFWLVILTFGSYLLLFLIPWGSVIFPFFKSKSRGENFVFYLVGGVTLLWIICLIRTENFVYTDEGGIGTRKINIGLKYLAIIGLIINYIIQICYFIKFNFMPKAKRKKRFITRQKIVEWKKRTCQLVETDRQKLLNWLSEKRLLYVLAIHPLVFSLIMLVLSSVISFIHFSIFLYFVVFGAVFLLISLLNYILFGKFNIWIKIIGGTIYFSAMGLYLLFVATIASVFVKSHFVMYRSDFLDTRVKIIGAMLSFTSVFLIIFSVISILMVFILLLKRRRANQSNSNS